MKVCRWTDIDLIMIWKLISFYCNETFCWTCPLVLQHQPPCFTVKWTISIKNSWQKLLAVISWGIKSIIVKVLDGKLVRVVRRDKGCSKLCSASATKGEAAPDSPIIKWNHFTFHSEMMNSKSLNYDKLLKANSEWIVIKVPHFHFPIWDLNRNSYLLLNKPPLSSKIRKSNIS